MFYFIANIKKNGWKRELTFVICNCSKNKFKKFNKFN